jgi:hypothetical protein
MDSGDLPGFPFTKRLGSSYRRSTGPVSLQTTGLLRFLIFDYFFCPWLRINRRPALRY